MSQPSLENQKPVSRKLTLRWLRSKSACSEGVTWFENCGATDCFDVLAKLRAEKQWSWFNWLIVRLMDKKQRVQYAVFSAEQVIGIFEKKYPKDDRPRKAIEAAKAWIDDPSEENRNAHAYAAHAAHAAHAACAAAYATAHAYAAACAAAHAAYAAYAAYAACAAACAAAYAAYAAAREQMRNTIADFGIKLLEGK